MLHFNHILRIKIDNRKRSLIKFESKLHRIATRTDKKSNEHWHNFFIQGSLLILQAIELEKQLSPNYFFAEKYETLKQQNYELHKEKFDENYKNSYANPEYAHKCFAEFGKLNSYLFSQILWLPKYAFEYDVLKIFQVADLFLKYYYCWKHNQDDIEMMTDVFRTNELTTMYELCYSSYEKRFSPKFDFYSLWIKTVDLSDLRYLFYYGDYIDDNTIQLAKYLNTLTQDKVDSIMRQTANAYIESFAESGKRYIRKKTVCLRIPIGMERLARSLIREMEERYQFKVCMSYMIPSDHFKQFEYDHRFSSAIFLDEQYTERFLVKVKSVLDDHGKLIRSCSGTIILDPFGEKPFSPVNKPECLKLSEEQIALNQKIITKTSLIYNKYYRRNENSFCIIAFPTPAIGKNFADIFQHIIDINMLNHDHWQHIQQFIIDALDQADYVHIKGCGDNNTDLKVKLPTLLNHSTETNFCNCGATVNIPVGEVFCTPQLTGTKGILHIPNTFLNGLQFTHLALTFTDGRITDYTCKNYENEAENKKYIAENLLFPHTSLPLGEFAIGTNTLAYQVAKKYKILPVLPILIIEKMGPHFAIGDTCYSWEEDAPVYNPDKKQIISRDNEQSILRKAGNPNAYYNIHTDITLPFDEIGSIRAVTANGKKIDIIKKGKFVLPGTQELNDYL